MWVAMPVGSMPADRAAAVRALVTAWRFTTPPMWVVDTSEIARPPVSRGVLEVRRRRPATSGGHPSRRRSWWAEASARAIDVEGPLDDVGGLPPNADDPSAAIIWLPVTLRVTLPRATTLPGSTDTSHHQTDGLETFHLVRAL